MTPYYEDDACVIYHGDCREVLPLLTDCSVLMTDPPYSSGGSQEAAKSSGSIGTRSQETIAYDNLSTRGYRKLMADVFRWANQCDEAFVFTDWRMWIETYDAVEGAGWRVRNMLVWDKINMGMGMPFRNQHELVAYGKRAPAQITTGNTGNVIRCSRSGNANHPTEKPVDLMRALLAAAVNTGTVLDPFMGSGTTLRAAKDLNRKAIGIELDERYCEIAAKRMAQEVLAL